jgi:magnesium transporter
MQKLRYHEPGTAPATLVAPPEQAGHKPVIKLIEYDAHSMEEHEVENVEEVFDCIENHKVSWIDVSGLGDVELLRQLGQHFRMHPLALEDILSPGQRPKVDEYEGQLFILLQMVYEDEEKELVFEQVSLLLGKQYLVTVQEVPGRDVFGPVRQRLREASGNARFMKSDYLAYALVDALIDHYFPIVESLGESIEEMQETVLERPTRERLLEVHEFRKALFQLRRAVWPARDVLARLWRDETGLISERTKPFLRDCYDNAMSIIDLLETYRDAIRNIMDLYLSSLSMRTNEVMRVLTVIACIFAPLTFIVGVYGMNFQGMPELHWKYGYIAVWLVMIAIAVAMFVYFKLKKWL